ncbi:unnamed protein product [Arctogadus glacialis]
MEDTLSEDYLTVSASVVFQQRPPGRTYFPRDRSPSGNNTAGLQPSGLVPFSWKAVFYCWNMPTLCSSLTSTSSPTSPSTPSTPPPPLLCRRPSCVSVSACSGGDRPREEEHRERNEKRPEQRAEECSEMWTRW